MDGDERGIKREREREWKEKGERNSEDEKGTE